MSGLDGLMTAQEVADYCKVGLGRVDEARRSGELPHVEFGPKTIRFRPVDVELWLAALLREHP